MYFVVVQLHGLENNSTHGSCNISRSAYHIVIMKPHIEIVDSGPARLADVYEDVRGWMRRHDEVVLLF